MSERITCKPTPWFLLRAAAMLLMFGVFSVMFFVDGKWGYREKNLSYFVSKAFEQAIGEFKATHADMSPEAWRSHAGRQVVELPEDASLLPEGTPMPMAWPEMLHDYERIKASLDQQPNPLFDDYRLLAGIKKEAPAKDYSGRKIFEQWVVFWVCLVLTIGALMVLLRTMGRSVAIDGEAIYPAGGGRVPFGDLVRLDLRKWSTKGLAFVWARTAGGAERKFRIDGLTYGGFKLEQGEPAERLMRVLRENFSGEVIDYAIDDGDSGAPATPAS
ncbi:MAG: hypothetical protein EAZ65_02095 [Verrucomicrobia bacterium]|nr:MAG: hypothetical protein EAZ84_12700 [Verrucomicrobiota bacterium]TAE88947.1 MAG: hypothetical protein EAZ82_02635 [Verrucomicrobiota bacterium]TAF27363.1 MAG: hypothetical protein EAZ71_02595 [Verrucomicrobiota bacterium]TAF42346.1 MAG: hypothetical protein EAZ65_02095 [Verrucomicrobiota bacterium]